MTEDAPYFDPDGDRRMNYALLAILIFQFVFVLGFLTWVGAPGSVVAILAGLVIVGNFANVYLLTFLMWKPLEERWPTQPALPGAVTRSFQTFWFGPIARFNLVVHAAVDEQHVHVTPMAPMRWLGAKPISLPLDDIVEAKRHVWPNLMQCTIHGRRIVGPAWCLSLAQPDE